MDENSEYRSKLFDIVNTTNYFLYECMNNLKNEQVILIGRNSQELLNTLIKKSLFFSCVCIKCI